MFALIFGKHIYGGLGYNPFNPAMVGYAVVYTVFLKRNTPHNIVLGGAAGAAPPILGWAAVTGGLETGVDA